MRIEAVNAEIRPRDSWEAMDLGLALARRDFWSLWGLWWLLASPWLLVAWWWKEHPFVWLFVFWWFRPAQSRLLVFSVSRRLFGEKPRFRDLAGFALQLASPMRWGRLTWGRLSPWLAVAMPVEELEGLKGSALRRRMHLVVNRASGATIRLTLFSGLLVPWVALALIAMGLLFLPRGQSEAWEIQWELWSANGVFFPPLMIGWTFSAGMAMAISLVDVFATGAGFGLYLNNRSWIEGWDVELVFKRLAERLRAVAALVVGAGVCLMAWGGAGTAAGAQQGDREREVIARVLEHEDFEVYSETIRVPKEITPDMGSSSVLGSVFSATGWLVLAVSTVAVVALIVFLFHRYRHSLGGRGGGAGKTERRKAMVIGSLPLEIDQLPGDPASVAARWWAEGRRREALALLYRAAIAWLVEHRQLEIGEALTEYDCMRRVEEGQGGGLAGYFRNLTEKWVALAYGNRPPSELEVEALCREWPFKEGKA